VKVLSIEDLLLWRLREWVHWHHPSGFHQAAHLLLSDAVDTERLDRRAREEGLTRALRELRKLTAEVEAGRIVTERSSVLASDRNSGSAGRPDWHR